MSKPRYDWWSYVKSIVKKYPALCVQFAHVGDIDEDTPIEELGGVLLREYEAVRRAINATRRLPDGEDRLKVVELVHWHGHTLTAAADTVGHPLLVVKRWAKDFVYFTAEAYGLLD